MLRNRNIMVLIIITLLMAGIAIFVSIFEDSTNKASFELQTFDGHIISPWYNEVDSTYYYFLPSYVDYDDVSFDIEDNCVIAMDGTLVTSGDTTGAFDFGRTYRATIANDKSAIKNGESLNIRFEKSAKVATLYVNTATDTMKSVYKSKNNREVAGITVVDKDGKTDFNATDAYIKGRGNSSWDYYDKKPFSLLFNEPQSILSMGASSKWVLLANALDKSGIRNALVYDTARNVGLDNTPDYEYVDLYLNGEYNGLYMLCQNPETFYERASDASNKCDGLYLFTAELASRAGAAQYPIWVENGEAVVDVCIPNRLSSHEEEVAEEIVHEIDNAITGGNNGTESSIASSDNERGHAITDRKPQLSEIIDIDSWVKKYLIDEIFENYDAGIASSYFYKNVNKADSKVYAGPVWDYDNTLGVMRVVDNPEILFANNTNRTATDRVVWYAELYSDEIFYNEMVKCFEESFIPQLESMIDGRITELSDEISASKKLDDIRWRTDSGEDYARIKEFLTKRLIFLKSIWLENGDYVKVTYYKPNLTRDYKRLYVPRGTSISEMQDKPADFTEAETWYIDGTSEVYDLDAPVEEELIIVNAASDNFASLKDMLENLRKDKDGIKIIEALGSLFLMFMLLLALRFSFRLRKGVR